MSPDPWQHLNTLGIWKHSYLKSIKALIISTGSRSLHRFWRCSFTSLLAVTIGTCLLCRKRQLHITKHLLSFSSLLCLLLREIRYQNCNVKKDKMCASLCCLWMMISSHQFFINIQTHTYQNEAVILDFIWIFLKSNSIHDQLLFHEAFKCGPNDLTGYQIKSVMSKLFISSVLIVLFNYSLSACLSMKCVNSVWDITS